MTRFSLALSGLVLAVGCGSSTPPAASPEAPAPEAAAAPPPAANAPPASTGAASDGWEGEGEAKSESPPDAAPAAPAAPAAGQGQVKETRTIEVIAKIVKDNRPAVRDCYEKARKDLPSLQGDMIIHFVVDPDGKVKTIELDQERSTLKAPPVVDCAIRVIRGITFPPSSRGMESVVNYPYNFMPGGPPQR